MLAAGGWIFFLMLAGELRQLVFCYGFFKVHEVSFIRCRNKNPQIVI
jgi:hypothetical protein